jgi:hypothetical protein
MDVQLTPIQIIGRLGLVDGSQFPRHRLRNSVIVLKRIVYCGTFRAEFDGRSLNRTDKCYPDVSDGNEADYNQTKNQFLKDIRAPCPLILGLSDACLLKPFYRV